jgi:hypothetical protein
MATLPNLTNVSNEAKALAELMQDVLDKIVATHFLLEFDNDGKYTKDASISIDFEKWRFI